MVDCEHLPSLTGYFDPASVVKRVAKRLNEPSCKGVFCWSRKSLENCVLTLGNNFPKIKSHVVYPATMPSIGHRNGSQFDGKVRMCHVSTIRNSYFENMSNFLVKGTRDLFLILKLMARSSPHLIDKLVVTVRAWCPQALVSELRAKGVNLEVIHSELNRGEVLSLLSDSDLAIVPCHSTPTMSFIEAMSRNVPVITNDIWANSEYVSDGESGFLIRPPSDIHYSDNRLNPLWYRPGFMQQLGKAADGDYLQHYANVIAYLVEDEGQLASLRKSTGEFFRTSEFNAQNRNQTLGTLLDKALG